MAPKTAANPLTKLGAPAALGVPLDADAANTWMAAVEADAQQVAHSAPRHCAAHP